MRLLLDNNRAPRLAVLLREGGHDTEHVRDHGMQAATDEQVLALARQQHRTLVSADTDFETLLARTGADGRRSSRSGAAQPGAQNNWPHSSSPTSTTGPSMTSRPAQSSSPMNLVTAEEDPK